MHCACALQLGVHVCVVCARVCVHVCIIQQCIHMLLSARSYRSPFLMYVVCGYPPLPVNGTAILSNTSRGVEVEYSCFTGGNLRGNQSAICLEDRSWSIPAPTCLCELEAAHTS